jgi:hypothetical protein
MKPLLTTCLAAALAGATFAAPAFAAVKHVGAWPDKEAPVTFDANNASREDALRRLADAAGWSLVTKGELTAEGEQAAPLTLHVKNQSPSKVLDLILSSGDFEANRDGTLVSIQSGDDDEAKSGDLNRAAADIAAAAASAVKSQLQAPAAPVPPVPAVPPVPPAFGTHHHKHPGSDRTVTGGHLTIEKDETVGDVTVLGGSVDVFGDVEGDLAVFGGSAHIHDGGEVHGDAVTLGGALDMDDGAAIDGDVSRIGGSFHSSDGAHVGGTAHDAKEGLSVSVSDDDDDDKSSSHAHKDRGFLATLGTDLTESSLLFVFGAVLLALATRRMDTLKVEVASRPMRSFALGVVASLLGALAICVLCITIIGIPLAFVGSLVAVVAVYGSITAVLTTIGQALVGHKTTNPYMHLGLGCLLLFVGGSIPVVGGFLVCAVVLTSIGALVATRAAGFVPPRTRLTPTDPYRSTAG